MHWGIRRYQPYPKGYSGAGKEVGEAKKSKISKYKNEDGSLTRKGSKYKVDHIDRLIESNRASTNDNPYRKTKSDLRAETSARTVGTSHTRAVRAALGAVGSMTVGTVTAVAGNSLAPGLAVAVGGTLITSGYQGVRQAMSVIGNEIIYSGQKHYVNAVRAEEKRQSKT